MTLTARALLERYPDQALRTFELAAAAIVFRSSAVGLTPNGYAKPFVVCDKFVGLADGDVDNTAGGKSVQLYVEGDFALTISGVTRADIGKAVYATADDTFSLTGHPDAFVGRVNGIESANKAVVSLKGSRDRLTEADTGSIEIVHDFAKPLTETGNNGGGTPVHSDGLRLVSALGLGVANVAGANGGADLEFDAIAEVAQASIETPDVFAVAKGITLEARLHLPDIGDAAALDADWGLGTAPTANSRADLDHADMVNLAAFHMDGAVANILAQSDDNLSDVAPTDTTIDNVLAAGSFKDFIILVRTTGSVEFYIDGARVIVGTTFAVAAGAVLAAFINLEKTSDNTTAKIRVDRLRVAGGRS